MFNAKQCKKNTLQYLATVRVGLKPFRQVNRTPFSDLFSDRPASKPRSICRPCLFG